MTAFTRHSDPLPGVALSYPQASDFEPWVSLVTIGLERNAVDCSPFENLATARVAARAPPADLWHWFPLPNHGFTVVLTEELNDAVLSLLQAAARIQNAGALVVVTADAVTNEERRNAAAALRCPVLFVGPGASWQTAADVWLRPLLVPGVICFSADNTLCLATRQSIGVIVGEVGVGSASGLRDAVWLDDTHGVLVHAVRDSLHALNKYYAVLEDALAPAADAFWSAECEGPARVAAAVLYEPEPACEATRRILKDHGYAGQRIDAISAARLPLLADLFRRLRARRFVGWVVRVKETQTRLVVSLAPYDAESGHTMAAVQTELVDQGLLLLDASERRV